MLSIVSNGNFPSAGPDVEAAKGGEVFAEGRGSEPAFHEMRLIREEFEANLLEAGLEIERDSEVSAPLCSQPNGPPLLFLVTGRFNFSLVVIAILL